MAGSPGAPGAPGAGAAISLRQTLASSKWKGQVCPKCGNELMEGEQVVLCPKCYTPQHAQCWQDNGNMCAVDQTAARIIVRPGQAAGQAGLQAPPGTAAAARPDSATPPAGSPARAEAPEAPTSATPAPPTPSADTSPAAQGRPGVSSRPPAAGAVRPEAAGGARPAPPRAVPGAAAAGGAARPARPGAAAAVREAPGLRPMAVVRGHLEAALGDLDPEFGVSVDEVSVMVPAARIQEACRRAKEHEQLRFDYLRCLSGVDYQAEGIEVVYHLFSTRLQQKCVLKARVQEGEGLPTVTPVWTGADWHEREAAEMFNIRFDGHPKPEPLLLQKDEEGRIVPGPILLKRFPLRPKEQPGIYGFPEEE
jgi:NADH-quinone oxidoreductase subunit C